MLITVSSVLCHVEACCIEFSYLNEKSRIYSKVSFFL